MEDTREKSSEKERYQRSDKIELLGDPQPCRIFPDSAACLSSMGLVEELHMFAKYEGSIVSIYRNHLESPELC